MAAGAAMAPGIAEFGIRLSELLAYIGTNLISECLSWMGATYPKQRQPPDGWIALACIGALSGWLAVGATAGSSDQAVVPQADVPALYLTVRELAVQSGHPSGGVPGALLVWRP